MLEEEEEEEEEANNPGPLLDERENGPGKPSSTEAQRIKGKYTNTQKDYICGGLVNVTWIFLVYAVGLWSISVHSLFTAPCFPGNHLIICGVPTISLCWGSNRKTVRNKLTLKFYLPVSLKAQWEIQKQIFCHTLTLTRTFFFFLVLSLMLRGLFFWLAGFSTPPVPMFHLRPPKSSMAWARVGPSYLPSSYKRQTDE